MAVDNKGLLMAQDDQLINSTASIGGFGMGLADVDWFLVCAN